MYIKCHTIYLWILIILTIQLSTCYQIALFNRTDELNITNEQGQIKPEFIAGKLDLACTMPQLYIYNDTTHEKYVIWSQGINITSIVGKYHKIQYWINCKQKQNVSTCQAVLDSACPAQAKNQMNWVIVELEGGLDFQYLVNCQPQSFYKPFQWGLFVLICFCTITITASSMYSRAWSYQGFGINVTKSFIGIFNILVIAGSILAYYYPSVTSLILKIVGSGVGTLGVMVCTSQSLWLVKNRKLNQARFGPVRLLDMISLLMGIILTVVYWLTNGMWIINDILAVCTIVASIKILKVRTLKDGVFMLFSLLIFQIIAGLIVHYVIKESYNNLVIQMFESPLVVVFPSITPQLHRRCAWIPLTNILFPGLFISYLRRFDKSRGTFLYLLIGYGTFYFGSILWMVIDMNIRHSLPMAIVSDPITVIIICIFAMRRNELQTIWLGLFYDPQLPNLSEQVLATNHGDNYIAFQQITDSLKIDKNRESQISQVQTIGQQI